MNLAVATYRPHRRDAFPGLAAVCAGVHGQGAADRARNAGEELGRPETPAEALAGKLRARHACTCPHPESLNLLEIAQHTRRRDDDAANPAVAYQQIAAGT